MFKNIRLLLQKKMDLFEAGYRRFARMRGFKTFNVYRIIAEVSSSAGQNRVFTDSGRYGILE